MLKRMPMPTNTKFVGYVLAQHADSDGTRVFPSQALVAVIGGLSFNTVQKAFKELRDAGLITMVRKATGRGQSNHYHLTWPDDVADRVLSPAQMKVEAQRLLDKRTGARRKRDPNGRGLEVEAADPKRRGLDGDSGSEPDPNGWGQSGEPDPNGWARQTPTDEHLPTNYLVTTTTSPSVVQEDGNHQTAGDQVGEPDSSVGGAGSRHAPDVVDDHGRCIRCGWPPANARMHCRAERWSA